MQRHAADLGRFRAGSRVVDARQIQKIARLRPVCRRPRRRAQFRRVKIRPKRNSADVDVADWIAALADDPARAAIACVFEGLAEPLRFLRAAERAWRRDKPLVVFKLATGEEGSAAALSHTASLAGSQAMWGALFDKAGAVVVDDFE